MTCRFAHDDAAYVLGALPPPERRAYEEHLTACPDCARAVQGIAGLPGLLSKVPVTNVLDQAPELPDAVLPALLASVRRDRHRRRWAVAVLGAAAACLAVLALIGVLATRHPGEPAASPAAMQLAPVGAVPIQAEVRLAALPWGTGIELHCSYPAGYGSGDQTYQLVAVDRTGAIERLASWKIAPGGQAHITATSTWAASDIAALEIRTPAGTPVMRLTT